MARWWVTVSYTHLDVYKRQPLDLTAREFELLHTFLAAPGRVFTREMLLAKLWGYDFYGDERVVDLSLIHICARPTPAYAGENWTLTWGSGRCTGRMRPSG